MKAEIKRFHSPDIFDLSNFHPRVEDNFGFLLQVMIGVKGSDGEESFDLIVCTPKWLEDSFSQVDVVFGEHYLIVFKYDIGKIKETLSSYVGQLEEENWAALANKIDRIGKWEFRDYTNSLLE